MMGLEFDMEFKEVEWEDTDVSEDEDYLPPFDKLCTSVGSSSSDFEDLFRMNKKENETPYDIVRRVVDKVIDNGIEKVDLGHIGLNEIPKEVGDLAYVTVLRKDIVKTASLQLYFLRNNQLTSIPPDIALLENLVELSLGNNQLKTLPSELKRLPKLTTLSLFPNPYLANDETIQRKTWLPSLVELCNRTILSHPIHLPLALPDTLRSSTEISSCENCRSLFHLPTVQDIRWLSVLGNHPVPFVHRFCSTHCSQ
ncbi:unnamed protein product [Rhizopus stolonifer]